MGGAEEAGLVEPALGEEEQTFVKEELEAILAVGLGVLKVAVDRAESGGYLVDPEIDGFNQRLGKMILVFDERSKP